MFFELIITLGFLGCLYVLQIDKLWDEKYLDSVAMDWGRSPFTDVVEVLANENCAASYEEIGKGYFWGVQEGCSCNNGNPPNVTVGACDLGAVSSNECYPIEA